MGRITPRQLRAKAAAALMLYAGASPLFLLSGALLMPGRASLSLLLPLGALLLAFGAGLAPPKRRVAALLAAIPLCALGCAVLLWPISPLALLFFLPCLALMAVLLPAMARPSGLEWPPPFLAWFLGFHVAAQALMGVASLAPVKDVLPIFFSAYLLGAAFTLNRYALLSGSGQGQSPPAALISPNRRMMAVVLALALPLANFRAVKTAFLAALDWLKRAFFTLILWLGSLFPSFTTTQEGGGQPQAPDLGGLAEAGEPGLLARILELVLMALGIAAVAILLAFLAYRLYVLIRSGLRALMRRWRAYARLISEGVEDQTESLFHWGEVAKDARDRWAQLTRRRKKPPDWAALSPQGRVRRVYALLLTRSRLKEEHLTAREALLGGKLPVGKGDAENMAALYEQARYSGHPVSPDQAEDMRKRAGV